MQEITVNEQVIMTFPDGFHVMTEEERSKMNVAGEGSWIGVADPDRHMIVSAGWRQAGGLAGILLNGHDIAKEAEKRIRKPMQPFGYRLEGFAERTIAGMNAYGFRYAYTAQDIGMNSETYAVKNGKAVMYFHVYFREELREESLSVWNDILNSARMK